MGGVTLPFKAPIAPMLSTAAEDLPGGEGWLFEPKWDGFRTLVFRDGDELLIQSRDEKPMNRYFPELVAPLAAALPERCVLDGEIVIVGPAGLDFEALLLRIHPAESRVKLLASQTQLLQRANSGDTFALNYKSTATGQQVDYLRLNRNDEIYIITED